MADSTKKNPHPKKANTANNIPNHFDLKNDPLTLKKDVVHHLKYSLARDPSGTNLQDWLQAVGFAVRDRILDRFAKTQKTYIQKDVRRVYYLSLEYLMGRMLRNNLINLEFYSELELALKDIGINLSDLLEEEPDMALGNGGLGRLAACFMDSLASLEYPAIGYGIYYEFGLFKQGFVNAKQVEFPDNWQEFNCPWSIKRPEYMQEVQLYGEVRRSFDNLGREFNEWINTKTIKGMPWDVPVVGYHGNTINFLRLWESRAATEFDLQTFNQGGYAEAVQEKALGETISKVLYPNDQTENGKELRLVQQYFFVTCSLKDIIKRFKRQHANWDEFSDQAAIQLNDTHPSIAIPELMRILLDEEKLEWNFAWDLCRRTFAYTNHTLLPEALEMWSVPLMKKVLPRHLQIIYQINDYFLNIEVEEKWSGDDQKKRSLSLIQEGQPQMIRMAYLSIVGSHAVNGVAALHTELLKSYTFRSFHELYPQKLNNKTNGITPRRWLKACNPRLSNFLDKNIGRDWPMNLELLKDLTNVADDSKIQREFMSIKHQNKVDLVAVIKEKCHLEVSANAIFDVQIKRLHEYKRQHLNLLNILTLYLRILQNPKINIHPQVFIFGAKAAPGYETAKNIIYAINKVAQKINQDPKVNDLLKIVFVPNYRISLAEKIIPATDLSEQISLAGKEASGTGNMKLALNGALTVGTLDGANVEILEEVGEDNIFIFGMNVEKVQKLQAKGYQPIEYYYQNPELRTILDWLDSDFFSPGEGAVLRPLRENLLHQDPFMVLADYRSYVDAQAQANAAYRDPKRWAKMALYNTACMGRFSSDRTIKQYAEEIWKLPRVSIS